MAMEATRGHSSRWLTGVGHFDLFESLVDIPVLLTGRANVSPDLSLVEIEPPITAPMGGLVWVVFARHLKAERSTVWGTALGNTEESSCCDRTLSRW